VDILRKTGDGLVAVIETVDFWGRIAVAAGAVALGANLLVGAAHAPSVDGDGEGRDSARFITGLSGFERVRHDYDNWSAEAGDDCLNKTPYDPATYYKYGDSQRTKLLAHVSVQGDVVTVHPIEADNNELPPLNLLMNNGSEPLQSADEQSKETLARFNCETSY
jgi:hypothetical protein